MEYPTVENLTAAANFLAASEQFRTIANEIGRFIRDWDESPKQYAGELAVLNPLIRLGVDHPDKYAKLMAKVKAARRGARPARKLN